MINAPVSIERTFLVPTENIWKAITNKDEMKKWYFNLAEFKPEVGFEFQFEGGGKEGKIYIHHCKIVEVVPGKKLKHSWSYEGYEGISYVTFELFDEEAATRLKLTHDGLETFPKDPDFKRDNFVEGWTYIIGTSLDGYLKNQ